MSLASKCEELCESGVCKSECCGVVPFEQDFFNKHAYAYGKKEWDKTEMMRGKDGKEYITAITKDLSCIFLRDFGIDKGKCCIYDNRPEVCQKFGDESHKLLRCPYISKDGKLRTKAETGKIKERVGDNHGNTQTRKSN